MEFTIYMCNEFNKIAQFESKRFHITDGTILRVMSLRWD
jgi:hypothetical protein